jgi:hypothetical protein
MIRSWSGSSSGKPGSACRHLKPSLLAIIVRAISISLCMRFGRSLRGLVVVLIITAVVCSSARTETANSPSRRVRRG